MVRAETEAKVLEMKGRATEDPAPTMWKARKNEMMAGPPTESGS